MRNNGCTIFTPADAEADAGNANAGCHRDTEARDAADRHPGDNHPGDLPSERTSAQLLRLLRLAAIVRDAAKPLDLYQIHEELRVIQDRQGEGSRCFRTTRRDLSALAVAGLIAWERGRAGRPGRWSWIAEGQ